MLEHIQTFWSATYTPTHRACTLDCGGGDGAGILQMAQYFAQSQNRSCKWGVSAHKIDAKREMRERQRGRAVPRNIFLVIVSLKGND